MASRETDAAADERVGAAAEEAKRRDDRREKERDGGRGGEIEGGFYFYEHRSPGVKPTRPPQPSATRIQRTKRNEATRPGGSAEYAAAFHGINLLCIEFQT